MPLPIITVSQMREWEKATWASGQTEEAVMRLAGRAVGRTAEKLTRRGDLVVILVGKGHNGDDARFAAESEHLSTRQVQVVKVLDPELASKELTTILQQKPALIIDG